MMVDKVNVGSGKLQHHVHSSQTRLLIKGGKVVNDDRMFDADIYVEGGCIKQVGTNLNVPGGVRVIDAKGKLVMPGGIDTHTHMQMPFMGTFSSDDFYSGTRAALAGGTTMIIDFVASVRNESILQNYHKYRGWADPKVCCDYALHVIVPHFDDQVATDMAELVKEHGINSFKVFMAYRGVFMLEDDEMYDVFLRCKELGAIAQVHAENGAMVEKKSAEVYARGIRGPEGHFYSRDEEVECEATARAIMLADQANCPLYVVHVMSKSAANQISDARREGKQVFGEPVCSGLACDGSHYFHQCWRHAAAYVMAPPIRAETDTGEYLMRLLANGDLECTGTDNCTFKADQKALGKDDFRKIPFGVNGVEDRMSVLWEKGVESGILDPCRYVAVTSSNAAKVFNIYPQKGRIDVGSDADIVIWDPTATRVISKDTHHQNVDFNIYEGMKCHGVPVYVITGGRVAVEPSEVEPGKSQLRVAQGTGRFIPTPNNCQYVYGKVQVRDTNRDKRIQPIKREPYSGPVIDLSQVGGKADSDSSGANGKGGDTANDNAKRSEIRNRGPTVSGGRNMQDSSFSHTGQQFDDNKVRTSIKTHNPPGGKSAGLW